MDTQSAAKLPFNFKIIPINEKGIPAGVPFLAMFNPEHLSITEPTEWAVQDPPASAGSVQKFVKVNARTFSVELTLDGTGVNTNGVKIPVTAQVILFRTCTSGIVGLLHQPAYLIVQYGLFISTCVLVSSTVDYTMFDFTGLPIRAKINGII